MGGPGTRTPVCSRAGEQGRVVGYDPNGVIEHTRIAGRELGSADTDGVVTITKDYADKLGFAGNYPGIVGRTITLRTRADFTGEGATITPPPANQGPNGDPGRERPPGQQTDLQAKVVGVVTAESERYTIFLPMQWSVGLMTERRYDMTAADRQALDAAQHNQQPGMPRPEPKYTLITHSEIEAGGYSSFVVEVDDVKHAGAIAKRVKTLGVGAVTAQSYMQDQLAAFNIVGLVLGGIGAIALAVATIGVVNTMVMANAPARSVSSARAVALVEPFAGSSPPRRHFWGSSEASEAL